MHSIEIPGALTGTMPLYLEETEPRREKSWVRKGAPLLNKPQNTFFLKTFSSAINYLTYNGIAPPKIFVRHPRVVRTSHIDEL